jgi:hypothetical protein
MYEVDLDENAKLAFLRERVIGFEKELAERIVKQQHVEKDIMEVGKMRHTWFESMSRVDDLVRVHIFYFIPLLV